MKEELERILNCMYASDVVLEGEYYLVHEDHIHDFKAAIDNYLEEKHKIEQIDQNDLDWIYLYNKKEMMGQLIHNVELLRRKVNEIVYELNKGDVK